MLHFSVSVANTQLCANGSSPRTIGTQRVWRPGSCSAWPVPSPEAGRPGSVCMVLGGRFIQHAGHSVHQSEAVDDRSRWHGEAGQIDR